MNWGGQASALVPVVLSLWAGSAAVLDWRSRLLPNMLTLGAVLASVGWLFIFARGPTGVPWQGCLAAGGMATLLTLPAYFSKAMGAGDVKLSVAMGMLGGLKVLFWTFILGGLVAGLLSIWLLVTKSDHLGSGKRTVPFGTALGTGFVAAIWASPML